MRAAQENMHKPYMMNWWRFPPQTREAQLDEKWGFVFKKEAHCTPDEEKRGDNWDHTAVDPESRLLLSVVPGKRTAESCQKVVDEIKQRTGGQTNLLITSDEHVPYKTAIERAYAIETPQPDGSTQRVMPKGLCCATVRKIRQNGRVVEVMKTLVFGTWILLNTLLFRSFSSKTVNTSFVERNNGTDRHQNGRKSRKTLKFSKDWEIHNAMTFFVGYSYNFCWPVRTLRIKNECGQWSSRTPAMAAGLASHIWSTREWVSFPAKPIRLI
ncbi:MAG: hypothetical protein HQL63_05850 [Magnetococcales bacterium]|nr:hypothetical protein [Magnetococcales bacterium]MBF0322010.1 hypothetical protein [Magnetococcales bacterium]